MKNGTKGYLYSMKTGELTVREGIITPNPWYPGHNRGKLSGRFYIDGKENKFCQCTIEPEVVYHDCLWLPERDDKFAEDLFVEREYEYIHELEEKIQRHITKIEQIRNGVS